MKGQAPALQDVDDRRLHRSIGASKFAFGLWSYRGFGQVKGSRPGKSQAGNLLALAALKQIERKKQDPNRGLQV